MVEWEADAAHRAGAYISENSFHHYFPDSQGDMTKNYRFLRFRGVFENGGFH